METSEVAIRIAKTSEMSSTSSPLSSAAGMVIVMPEGCKPNTILRRGLHEHHIQD